MKDFLLIRSCSKPFAMNLNERFIEFDVDAIYASPDSTDYLYSINQDEYFLDQITCAIDDAVYKDCKAVIIDRELGNNNWMRAIGLAGHIACHLFTENKLNKLPILLVFWEKMELSEPELDLFIIANIFQCKGIYMRTYQETFIPRTILGTDQLGLDAMLSSFKSPNVGAFKVVLPRDDSHQSTNEWGALRLAKNMGMSGTSTITYPRHLYFKYLTNFLITAVVPKDISLQGLFKNALLIDDNADRGWGDVLKETLGCTVEKLISCPDVTDKLTNDLHYFNGFEIIFLDLYLTKGTNDISFAISVLKEIKEEFPQLPVIIFTASEKSLSMRECLDHGADGLYIKESPLYFNDQAYSRRNTELFKNIIRRTSDKYRVLRPYWNGIQEMLKHPKFLAMENSPRLFRDRIDERLKMFYGLLKKGFEEWTYDRDTFFYSDHELAFMTLWSVLNEVQEWRFVKTKTAFPLKDSNGKSYFAQKDRTVVINDRFKNWTYHADGSTYIKYWIKTDARDVPVEVKYGGTRTGKYALSAIAEFGMDSQSSPYFFSCSEKILDSPKAYYNTISMQIAFVIEKINPSTKSDYFISLFNLNKLRNTLYLTHGSSEAIFYSTTERARRITTAISPTGEISKLFDLVYLLLTEDETNKIIFT